MTAQSGGVRQPDPEPSLFPPARLPFFRAVLASRFETSFTRFVILGLAVLVAIVAINAGAVTAVGLLTALGLVFGIAIVATERDRWAAQDVIVRFRGQRRLEWLRDTGTEGTNGSRAEAEVWLGVHRVGSVPQRYRAIIAEETGDPVVLAHEMAALPDETVLDRANREQLLRSWEWSSGAVPDTTALRTMLEQLPDTLDRRMLETWLATVDSSLAFERGERDWLRPLLSARESTPRPRRPVRWYLRVWVSRFTPLIALAVGSALFAAIGFSVSGRGDALPATYAQTELSARGDLASSVAERVWRTLPRLERALPDAVRIRDGPLTADAVDDLISDGLPSLIWTVDRISVAGPPSLAGERVYEIEVLLGQTRFGGDLAIVTVRGPNGSRYLYRLDPSVVADLRAAAGVAGP